MNNARLSAQYCFVTFPYSPHRMRVGSLPVLSHEVNRNSHEGKSEESKERQSWN